MEFVRQYTLNFDSPRVKQKMAKQGIKPVKKSVMMLKIVIASFFSRKCFIRFKRTGNKARI